MNKKTNFHESLSRNSEIKVGSNKAFGLLFSVVFTLIAAWPLFYGEPPRFWASAFAITFFIVSIFFHTLLKPLNIIWFKFGLFLHKIINPLVMGMLFLTTIIPIGLIMRIVGYDPLKKDFDKKSITYWIPREPAAPKPDTMINQF